MGIRLRSILALAIGASGCTIEVGPGLTRSLSSPDLRGAIRVAAGLRNPRGHTPFVGGELFFSNTPHIELRAISVRAGYAWVCPFFCARAASHWGLELGLLGGLGASPDPAARASGLGGYHLGASLALPITIYGGGDASAGLIIGSVALAIVPEIQSGFWGPADHASASADLSALLNFRIFARSDLARAEGYPDLLRAR